MSPKLLEKYKSEIIPIMMKKFNYKNPLQVPRLEKIVINMGVGEAAHDIKILEKAMAELSLVCGQKPVMRRAKKAISNFKIKKGNPVGCKVTLRRKMMYEFLDRFINIVIPRIRDFRGLSVSSFDEGGNYNLGISEQTIFPEIDYDKVERIQGMDINICTTAKKKEEALELLKLLGMPFKSTD